MKTKLTSVTYLGYTAMDRRFSSAMIPWLIKEIKKTGVFEKLSIVIEDGFLKAYNGNFEPVLIHRLLDIIRASQVPGQPEELFYILYNEKDSLLSCYLFRTEGVNEDTSKMNPRRDRSIFTSHSDASAIKRNSTVSDLFSQMRSTSGAGGSPRGSTGSLTCAVMKNSGFQAEGSTEHLPWNNVANISLTNNSRSQLSGDTPSPLLRSTSNASALTSLCADLSPSDSHFFEVLYIGKVRISQRKVPESLIDDALVKFALHEAEKGKVNQMRRHSLLSSTGTSVYSNDSTESLAENKSNLKSADTSSNLSETKKVTFSNTSTTPLEPDNKITWNSVDTLEKDKHTQISDAKEVDDEFDMFTKERVVKNGSMVQQLQRPKSVPLEPKVLILNVPNKNNLGTVEEDEEKSEEKHEDLKTVISETASSITQFCQSSIDTNNEVKENNPFLPEIKNAQIETQTVPIDKLVDVPLATDITKTNKVQFDLKKDRQDSPAPMNFDEISRKPKILSRSKTGLENNELKRNSIPENKPFLRDRSASIGTLNLKTPITQLIGEQNRTMLFQVGRSELRLISPDRKQILLHRAFKDVASCVLGRMNKEHFGFVCRESASESYACYVFKCESDCVALEVVNAIKQAFVAHAELMKKSREKSPNLTCEHCPMLWYHRLCHDVEGMNEKKTHAFILRRIEQLPDDEQEQIITKYQGGTNHMYEVSEHNAFLMMLLRAHCESKQTRHVHDTAENRSEFLNQYLGGSTIFMKAKRSLSSGFDQLLKRKASRDEVFIPPIQIKKEASPLPNQSLDHSPTPSLAGALLSPDAAREATSISPSRNNEPPPSPTSTNPPLPIQEDDEEEEKEAPSSSPMMDIFLKVSDSRPTAPSHSGEETESTWRQAIYKKVLQPDGQDGDLTAKNLLNLQEAPPTGKRSKEQLRQLWKMAIDQTVLLVRMEKENVRLKEREESSAVRRIKLEYTELGVCDAGVTLMWDSLLATRDTNNQVSKVDHHMLTQAVIRGVPRVCRGGVWYFLAEQACLRSAPPDSKKFPYYNTPYRTLLAGLTKHQHAILIDLGRTFPQHSYFASALGPGQLSLYNLLKAYSLLDPDVGYCQGLSFVAGVLLLHMDEAEAFILLRHLMFRRGLRKQYLPDMSALQVQLYQLSRLLRDHEPELHDKFEELDISPALYAAPWMLTLFTSQFPLGFVVRVFDLIFLESLEIIFAVSLALLSTHKDGLMLCESCEEAAEYLKHKLPDMDRHLYEKVMKKVITLDLSRQLSEYAVEYAVLREEMPRVTTLVETNKKLAADNRRMSDELDSAMDAITNYQTSQSKLESQNKVMEQQLTLLSRYVSMYQKQELPNEIKKIVQNYNKKPSFGSKIFSNKHDEDDDPRKNFKSGMSTPNLFAKINKEELLNAINKEKNDTESDRKHFMMKKSQSVHSGLIANQKHVPLKVLEEKNENKRQESFRRDSTITESLKELGKKNSGFFANTHEQIRQERLFEQQLKHDFDENLKKLDSKLDSKINNSYMDDLSVFQSRKCMSLNIANLNNNNFNKNNNIIKEDKEKEPKLNDSGFGTPMSPAEDRKVDTMSIISHPLSDCDIEIKFDGQSTKLKQIRPIIKNEGRNNSVDSLEKNMY